MIITVMLWLVAGVIMVALIIYGWFKLLPWMMRQMARSTKGAMEEFDKTFGDKPPKA